MAPITAHDLRSGRQRNAQISQQNPGAFKAASITKRNQGIDGKEERHGDAQKYGNSYRTIGNRCDSSSALQEPGHFKATGTFQNQKLNEMSSNLQKK